MIVWLVGMPGSGKSAVGAEVAGRLGLRFIDADIAIAFLAGRDIPAIFAEAGEEGFRSLETEVIVDLATQDGVVIAAGGGAVLRPANREAMRASGAVVLLDAPVEALRSRLGNGDGRPLLEGATLAALAAERSGAYRAAAHHVVDASAPIDEVVEAVLEAVAP